MSYRVYKLATKITPPTIINRGNRFAIVAVVPVKLALATISEVTGTANAINIIRPITTATIEPTVKPFLVRIIIYNHTPLYFVMLTF